MVNIGDITLQDYTPSPVSLGVLIPYNAVMVKMGAKWNSVYIAPMYVPCEDDTNAYIKALVEFTIDSIGYILNNDKLKSRTACAKLVSTTGLFFIILPITALLNMTIKQ